MTFQDELERLINRHGMETGSDTPDFLLARYLSGCLDLWNGTIQARETWYGRSVGVGDREARE